MSYEDKVLRENNFDTPPVLWGCKSRPRTKLSDIIRENAYNDIINDIGWNRFEWLHIPEYAAKTLTSEMIERATLCGAGVVYQVPESLHSASSGMWVCTPVEWIGVKRADNTSEGFITYLPRGDYATQGITGGKNDNNFYKINGNMLKNFVIIRNNFEMTSDYDFTEWTAKMLNETDISEMQLIKWSRMTPIAKTTSDADTAKLENVLRRVYGGEPWAVVSDFSKMINGGGAGSRDDYILRLTDETAIEKMHFLSEFHYELIRRLCNLYNIPFHTTAKSAQNLESEIHNMDIFSRMKTENGLKWRKKSCPDFSVFGEDWKNVDVRLSEMFRKENEVIDNNMNDEKLQENNVSRETTVETEEQETGGGDTE